MSAIRTVRGPVDPSDVRTVDAHAHLHIAPGPPGSPVLADEAAAEAELRGLAAAGGELVVDCQPGGCGRDGAVLARLSRATGVAVVAATGFHLRRHYAPGTGPWAQDEDAAHARFAAELQGGLAEAPDVRAGVVKAAWTGSDPGEAALLRAALRAAAEAGVGTIVHTEAEGPLDGLLAAVADAGVAPGAVQLSHVDKRPDRGLHAELVAAGFVLGYDTFVRAKWRPEERVWPLLLGMVEDGHAGRITLGLDLVDAAAWRTGGGPGLRALPATVLPRLEAAGVPADALAGLRGRTAATLLATADAPAVTA